MAKQPKHPIHTYCDEVISGKRVTGELERLGAERFIRDLERGKERGIHFDWDEAQLYIDFFSLLKHWKGSRWAGKPIVLEPWQQFIIGNIFGWKFIDTGLRRFREAYEQIARKNAKTTIAGGSGLAAMFLDGEHGAEIYSYATKKDQAKLVFNDAKKLIKNTPALNSRVEQFVNSLIYPGEDSKFEPLGSDSEVADGFNTHLAIGDETHAQKDRSMYDVMDSSTGSRAQPLILNITTAGFNPRHWCKTSLRDYGERVLRGKSQNDRFFFFIAELDKGDDWQDRKVWPKGNPNLGVSVFEDDLMAKFDKAVEDASAQNNFRCKHLNEWVNQLVRWMSMAKWAECNQPVDEKALYGKKCWSGLDLSQTEDLTALVHVFPCDDAIFRLVCRFWVPEEQIERRSKQDRVPYEDWLRQGWIRATPGAVIEYDDVRADIEKDAEKFKIQELAFDRFGATQMSQQLDGKGLKVFPFPQTITAMSPATKELLKLVLQRRLGHGNNAVLEWNAENVVTETDSSGNIKPSKRKSNERIDGIVALVMALDRAIRNVKKVSLYAKRGIRRI